MTHDLLYYPAIEQVFDWAPGRFLRNFPFGVDILG